MRIVVKDMNYDRDLADLFQQSYGEAVRAARNLSVSIKRTTSLFPLSAAAMAQLDDEALERLDAFRVRYAQLQDVLAGQSHERNGLGGLTVLGGLWFIAAFFAR